MPKVAHSRIVQTVQFSSDGVGERVKTGVDSTDTRRNADIRFCGIRSRAFCDPDVETELFLAPGLQSDSASRRWLNSLFRENVNRT
jgi:hypothetical protein